MSALGITNGTGSTCSDTVKFLKVLRYQIPIFIKLLKDIFDIRISINTAGTIVES